MGSQTIAFIAAGALLAGGFAVGAETRSMGALPRSTALAAAGVAAAAEDEKCVVEVVRTRAPNTSQIERDERQSDGRCICRIFTGPEASNGAAESVVEALWRDRECSNAPAAPIDGSTAGAASGATGGSGGAAGGAAAGGAGGGAGGAGGAAAGAAGGGLGGAVLPAVFGAGAVGLGAGLAGASKG